MTCRLINYRIGLMHVAKWSDGLTQRRREESGEYLELRPNENLNAALNKSAALR